MGDLSQHFSRNEFTCHCCGRFQLDPRLLQALEKLRALAGAPIAILCGYRCPEHNQQVGGAANSEHLRGRAADIKIVGLNLQLMYELALQVPEFQQGGIGVYDHGFLHVDVREHPARWAQVASRYVGVYALVREPVATASPESMQAV